jgi:cysteine-rich repeat protein
MYLDHLGTTMHVTTLRRLGLAILVLSLGTTPSAMAVDFGGTYISSSPLPCRLTSVITGTMVDVSGSCTQGGTSYPVTFNGTIDPETGTASVSGEIPGLCGEMHCSSTGDGEEIDTTCTSITPACNVSFVGTKCGNGIVDELENCGDGNLPHGACCSPRCQLRPAGTPCDAGDSCAVGSACDAAGSCVSVVPAPAGRPCAGDGDPCTADACDGTGTCMHTPLSPEACRQAGVDLSGDYVGSLLVPFTVRALQTGSALQLSGHVIYQSATYPLSATGTVDPATRKFSVAGEIGGLCAEFTYSGTGDSEEMTGTFTCPSGYAFYFDAPTGVLLPLSKCGNGVIDSLENCETGINADRACCSTRCRLLPAGTACAGDGDVCTGDVCNTTGACTHGPSPECRASTATRRRDLARCMATQCAGISPGACRRRCKPARIRTLAYVLSECRVDAAGNRVARQALRIRRGDRDPITVVEFPPSEPVPDRQGICAGFRAWPWGGGSVVAFPLQRLGVTPDGSGVVFEVNDDLLFSRFISVPPDQKGLFFVRSDGRGLRRLGPPSRDPTFRLGADFIDGSKDAWKAWILAPPMFFSPDGRRVAFTDLGPGPRGEEAVQVFVLDLATGERKQVTHLTSGPQPPFVFAGSAPYLLTCCPEFIDDKTIRFQSFVDPDGSNPQHDFTAFAVGIDGQGLRRALVPPVALPGSHLVPSFAVTGSHRNLVRLFVPGTPENVGFPTTEVFLNDGKNLTQLTNFHRIDTFLGFLNPARTRAFVLASADPLGMNPDGFCQIFSMNTQAGGLRQVTHLNSRVCPPRLGQGCFQVNGIGYGYYRIVFQDPVTEAVIFDSACDPLGANRDGDQLFAMRPDGSGLRQLTGTSGITTNPDGSIRVELPGPFAYSATPH